MATDWIGELQKVHFSKKNGASGSWAAPYFTCPTLR